VIERPRGFQSKPASGFVKLKDSFMKLTLFALISFLLGSFLSAQTPVPSPISRIPPKIPLRDFFRNPVSRGYDLSPDGQTISFLQPWESRLKILQIQDGLFLTVSRLER
jgi:hypothetical protein